MSPFLYAILGGLLLSGAVGLGQELRLASARLSLRHCEAAQAQARQELEDYQRAASAEIAKRLQENAAIETARKEEVANARQDYARRIDAINARWLRKPPAAGDSGAMPSAGIGQGGAVDGAPGDYGLPRCIREDRRAELEALLREAEVSAAKLLQCQKHLTQ